MNPVPGYNVERGGRPRRPREVQRAPSTAVLSGGARHRARFGPHPGRRRVPPAHHAVGRRTVLPELPTHQNALTAADRHRVEGWESGSRCALLIARRTTPLATATSDRTWATANGPNSDSLIREELDEESHRAGEPPGTSPERTGRAAAAGASGPAPTPGAAAPTSRRAASGAPGLSSAEDLPGTPLPTEGRSARRSRHPPGSTRRVRWHGQSPEPGSPPRAPARSEMRRRCSNARPASEAAGESAEPAEAAAGQEQVEERPLAPCMFDRPDELGACQAADDSGHRGVERPDPAAPTIAAHGRTARGPPARPRPPARRSS